MSTPLVEMRNITKIFPGVVANDKVNLIVKQGQIHALLGENGSGKSTLMSILCGLYSPTEGEIWINGKLENFTSPKDAINCGIGMIHQHFKLIDSFTVLENILLGKKNTGLLLSQKQVEVEIVFLAQKYGFKINPQAYIWQLSVGEKQQVEILRTLYYGSRILIMDEPTAVLTPQETQELFVNLQKMAQDGCAIIFIAHKLNEVMKLSDCVTVLRSGRVTGYLEKEALEREKLAKMMVGREVANKYQKKEVPFGEVVLELQVVKALNDMGNFGLKKLNLKVRAGEIYCIAGVSGNGQKELAEIIAGIRPIYSGKLLLTGQELKKVTPRLMLDKRVSYVPEDRLGMGLIPDMDSCENIILKDYNKKQFSGRFFLKTESIEQEAEKIVKDYDVKQSSIHQPVKMMSGGNLQKLLLAREIKTEPKLMVVSYPARGLDIGAIEAVHKLLLDLKEKNTALVIISEDLEEISKLADTVGVIFEGEILGEFAAQDMDIEKIGLLMAGVTSTTQEVQGKNAI